MAQAGEPVFVQALIPETPVKRFDVGVLIGLSGLDEEQLNPTGVCPGEHGAAAELLAVIGPDRFGQAACCRQLVEDARQMQAAHRPFRHNRDGLMRGIIDHGQILDDTPLCRPVEHEVHRPDLIGGQGTSQWVTVCYRYLLALPPANLQPRLGIEPIHPLVIDDHAFLPQLQVNHAGAVTAVALRERDDLRFQGGIAVGGGLVAE